MERKCYSGSEMNAKFDRLENKLGEKMDPRFRRVFILLNNLGLFDAFCELCAETPDEKAPDFEWFKSALDEAQRRVSA